MTYVPVDPDQRKGHGRNPLDIPDALLSQLRHSLATGARCQIDGLTAEDEPMLAELKRTLIRAGYRHFSEHTIFRRRSQDGATFTYWVGPKKARRDRRNGGTK